MCPVSCIATRSGTPRRRTQSDRSHRPPAQYSTSRASGFAKDGTQKLSHKCPEQDPGRCERHHAQVVPDVLLPAGDHAAAVVEPCKGPFDFPAALRASQRPVHGRPRPSGRRRGRKVGSSRAHWTSVRSMCRRVRRRSYRCFPLMQPGCQGNCSPRCGRQNGHAPSTSNRPPTTMNTRVTEKPARKCGRV